MVRTNQFFCRHSMHGNWMIFLISSHFSIKLPFFLFFLSFFVFCLFVCLFVCLLFCFCFLFLLVCLRQIDRNNDTQTCHRQRDGEKPPRFRSCFLLLFSFLDISKHLTTPPPTKRSKWGNLCSCTNVSGVNELLSCLSDPLL